MTFTRTTTGITNLHLFHGVDVVVFVEGGTEAFSYSDVCQGQSGSSSPDILYWRAVFQSMCPDKRVCFKPVGSKGTLERLAKDVASGQLTNVYVAMDQDHDKFLGRRIEAAGVFYTWGYSWENDLLHQVVIKETVFAVCPIDRTTHENAVGADIASSLQRFRTQARWFASADVVLSVCGCAFFDRTNWKQYIKSSSGQHGEPYFDAAGLRSQIRTLNSSKGSRRYQGVTEPIKTERDCFGHVVGVFLFRLFSHLVAKYSGSPSFSMLNACALLIRAFHENFSSDPSVADVRLHHETQFAFLTP